MIKRYTPVASSPSSATRMMSTDVPTGATTKPLNKSHPTVKAQNFPNDYGYYDLSLLWHLDRVSSTLAWDVTTGSKQVGSRLLSIKEELHSSWWARHHCLLLLDRASLPTAPPLPARHARLECA